MDDTEVFSLPSKKVNLLRHRVLHSKKVILAKRLTPFSTVGRGKRWGCTGVLGHSSLSTRNLHLAPRLDLNPTCSYWQGTGGSTSFISLRLHAQFTASF